MTADNNWLERNWRARAGRMGTLLICCGLLAASAATRVLAQPPRLAGMEDRRQQFELLRMWRLVDELGIDEQQAERVFPVFRRHRASRDSLTQARHQVLARLRQQLDTQADEEALTASIEQARAAEAEEQRAEQAFAEELSTLLSTRQQAQLLLFDATFRSELQDVVRRMRGGRRAGDGGGAEPEPSDRPKDKSSSGRGGW